MQKLAIHPPSLLAGTALAVLAFVAMAPAPPPPSALPIYNGIVPAVAMVQIAEGVPYVVPAGKMLVITGVGETGISGIYKPSLRVNAAPEITTFSPQNGGNAEARSIVSVPVGFAIPAGSVVTVDDGNPASTEGRAWGYLDRT